MKRALFSAFPLLFLSVLATPNASGAPEADPKKTVEEAKDKSEAIARDMRFEIDRHKEWLKAAKKKFDDTKGSSVALRNVYGKCPSTDAQSDYDRARTHALALEKLRRDAEQQYDALRKNCIDATTAPKTACQPAVQVTTAAMTLARPELDTAIELIDHLKATKCIASCDKLAKAVVPIVTTAPVGNAAAPPRKATVCVAWEPGVFGGNIDSGDGELSAESNSRVPRCAKKEEISLCNAVDVNAAFPVLKATGIFPPGLDPSVVKVIFPSRSLDVVSGVTAAPACKAALDKCGSASAGQVPFPLAEAVGVTKQPTQHQQVAALIFKACPDVATSCNAPPYGVTSQVPIHLVADPRAATISWASVSVPPGQSSADFTKPSLEKFCTGFTDPASLAQPPKVNIGKKSIELPICEKPREALLIAKP